MQKTAQKVTDKPKQSKNEKKLPFWSTIAVFAKDERRRVIFVLVASVLTGIMVAVQPLIIRYIVDDGISNTSLEPEKRLQIAGFFCLIYVAA